MLDAAKKLSISAKSHSSSISDIDANKIKELVSQKTTRKAESQAKQNAGKEILSLKKASELSKTQSKSIKKQNEKKEPSLKSKPSDPPKIHSKSPKPPSPPKAIDSQKQQSSQPLTLQSPSTPRPKQVPISKPSVSPPIQPKTTSVSKSPNKEFQPPVSRKLPVQNSTSSKKIDIVSKPKSLRTPNSAKSIKPAIETKPNNPNPPQAEANRPQAKAPQRPIAPPPRPKLQPNFKPKPGRTNQSGVANRNTALPQRNPGIQPRRSNNRNNLPTRDQGKPPTKSNKVELVGAPIRRNSNSPTGIGGKVSKNENFRQGSSGSVVKQSPQRRSDGNSGGRSQARPRPGMPSGMRKPVAPGELMQLQKPTNKVSPPIKRSDIPKGPKRESSQTAKPPTSRPTPSPSSAPKRPPQRIGSPGSSARKRKPDWDDAAKLEALRNKSPQKQRQKVHIIGENDDALTAETSGFAGGQQAVVLSASLARPSTPKNKVTKKQTAKPSGALKKRKKESTRQRQRRRAMELRAAREAKQIRPEMIVVPEDNITVQELADKLSVESSEIIKSLFFKGITATVTQSLDLQTIETVAEEFGVPVLQDDVEEAAKKTVEMIEETDIKHLMRRPPVVTVMGHVDHGKTSLLDAIRKARVAAGEAGGITQHIGAYQVDVLHDEKQRKLTFLDTPGHAAFTAMRARGTKVTDVAILVVAADDGVRPQTLEAISHARAAKVPIVVAINKTDKEGASPDRVKQELSEHELVAEEWGGDVVMIPVSAIKGENIDKLLEMILLVTEVEDLQANPDRLAKGTVIEAHLDKAKGPVATLLVQNGTLKSGDVLTAGPVLGKVRAMVDENGQRLKEAGPSCPVEALGFNEVPTAGDEFEVYPDEKSARNVVGERASDARATRLAQQMASRRVSLSSMSGQANEGDLKELNLILKADVQGSVEAILSSLEQLPKDEVQVRVLLSAPGEITETDVDLAAASGAAIIGFNTSMASGAKRAADANGVDVRDYEVIYKLLEDIQLAMEGLLEPDMVEEKIGEAEVRAIFNIGKSAVAGCYISNGKLQRNCKVRVKRAEQIVFEGDLDSLRRNRDVVKDVSSGFECGVGCDRFANWKEGDIIEGYKLVTQRRKLST